MFHQIMISKTYLIVKQFVGKMILFDIIKKKKNPDVSYLFSRWFKKWIIFLYIKLSIFFYIASWIVSYY